MNHSELIGNKYKFVLSEGIFYITGFSLVSKNYEIAAKIDYGNGGEWTILYISFDAIKHYEFIEKVDIESLNIKIKEPKIKYLK